MEGFFQKKFYERNLNKYILKKDFFEMYVVKKLNELYI